MATTETYRTETINGHIFEWTNTEYVSATGGDHTRTGYKLDSKRVSLRTFYTALSTARGAVKTTKESPSTV